MKLKSKRLSTSFQSGIQAKLITQLNKSPRVSALLQRKRSGFTLVELVVNMAIIGIIMVIVTMLTSTSLGAFNKQNKKLDAVNLGDLVVNTISDQISKSNKAKLCNYFVEIKELDSEGNETDKVYDQTGNSKPDWYITDKEGHHYPICLDDMQVYNTIVLIPDKAVYENSKRNQLVGADRRGKLYKLRINSGATVHEKDSLSSFDYVINQNNKPIAYTPLFDESYYKGYLVDVTFEYVSKMENKPDKPNTNNQNGAGGNTDSQGETGENANAGKGVDTPETIEETHSDNLNSIKINVDVYDGATKIYSVSNTVAFIQYFFTMQEPTKVQGTADLKPKKDMILFI